MPDYVLLKDAYYGEGGFLAGGYLIKHARETDTNYSNRQKISFYENYYANIVNALVDPIFRKDQIRDWGKGVNGDMIQNFVDNCDNNGTPLREFMHDSALRSKNLGAIFIAVDNFKEVPNTMQQAVNDRNFAYAYIIEPEYVEDYTIDRFGHLTMLKTKEDIETGDNKKVTRVTIYDDQKIKVTEDNKLISEVAHGLGIIPVVYFPSREGSRKTKAPTSEMEPLARMAKAMYNKQSWLDEILKNQTFSILTIPDPSAKDLEIGTNNAITYDGTATTAPSYIAPPDGPANTLITEIKRMTENMYRACGLSFIIGTKADTSGESKKWDFERVNQTLSTFAKRCETAEKSIVELFCKWQNISDSKYSVQYADDFGIIDVATEIQTAQSVLDLDLVDDLKVEILKRVLAIYFPEMTGQDVDKLVKRLEEKLREGDYNSTNTNTNPNAGGGSE